MNKEENESYKKAGIVAKQIKEYAESIIKPGAKLVDIAEQIEAKIKELGAEVGFPVNLAIDDIAAHSTPTLYDESIAEGLLKIDIGVHIDGFIADTAITIDLTKEKKHKELIESNQNALNKAIDLVKKKKSEIKINEIGKLVHENITSSGFSPVRNLSGHSLDKYQIHSGLTIPNYDNGNENQLGEGVFAIEPFATYGQGVVYEGDDSSIYHLAKEGQPRDNFAREVLEYIGENKKTLPFSERELEREFGPRARLAIKRLLDADIIKSFPKLVEKSHQAVTQAENTIIIHKDKVEVITE